MTTTTAQTRCQAILDEMAKIPVIVPGKLGQRRNTNGKITGWKLQRWHKGRNDHFYDSARRFKARVLAQAAFAGALR